MFVDLPEMMILVPPLLGLRGNLAMTLASRLSTQVIASSSDVQCCYQGPVLKAKVKCPNSSLKTRTLGSRTSTRARM